MVDSHDIIISYVTRNFKTLKAPGFQHKNSSKKSFLLCLSVSTWRDSDYQWKTHRHHLHNMLGRRLVRRVVQVGLKTAITLPFDRYQTNLRYSTRQKSFLFYFIEHQQDLKWYFCRKFISKNQVSQFDNELLLSFSFQIWLAVKLKKFDVNSEKSIFEKIEVLNANSKKHNSRKN